MSTIKNQLVVFALGTLLLACGGESSGEGDGGPVVDGGSVADADLSADADITDSPCGFENRYLPYRVGYKWTYKVIDLANPGTTNKSQTLTAENDPDFGNVIVQTTLKPNGSTVSALKRVGDAVVRLRQLDLDQSGTLVRTTTYDPGQTRLDESAANIAMGAQHDDMYEINVTKVGQTPVIGNRTDHWEVLGVDVDCMSPFGATKCLHVRRLRTAGGISDKQFFFAKGIGKVKEVNANQVEELVSCEKL